MSIKKPYIFVLVVLISNLFAALPLSGYSLANTSKLKVVTRTSLIAQIVQRVGEMWLK
jgi:ABC-type Zn uptake system ZnuABC Zn-binding protein ZnuA